MTGTPKCSSTASRLRRRRSKCSRRNALSSASTSPSAAAIATFRTGLGATFWRSTCAESQTVAVSGASTTWPVVDDDLRLGAVDRLLQLREERGRSDGGRQHREHDPLPAADDADVPAQAAAPVLELDRLRHATHCSAGGSISWTLYDSSK